MGTIAAVDAPFKGQDDVIEAVGILKKNNVYVNYKLVGHGNPQRLLKLIDKHNVKDRVQIIGGLDHEKVFEFIKNIDLYIQPSKKEGLPRALIEAMSKACPAIGARTAGIPELISDDCIFNPGSVSEIVDIIYKINREFLIKHARINFAEAKKYQKETLKNRRIKFFNKFLDENTKE